MQYSSALHTVYTAWIDPQRLRGLAPKEAGFLFLGLLGHANDFHSLALCMTILLACLYRSRMQYCGCPP